MKTFLTPLTQACAYPQSVLSLSNSLPWAIPGQGFPLQPSRAGGPLSVSNVPELTRFFQAGFGFRVAEQRGTGKFAVLFGEDGFALILMHDKNVTSTTYPVLFHVGFLLDSQQQVHEHHTRIIEAGFDAPPPKSSTAEATRPSASTATPPAESWSK